MSAFFFCEDDASKSLYLNAVKKSAEAAVSSLSGPKAYEGPSPVDLGKQISSINMLPEKGLGFDSMLDELKKSVLPNFLRTASKSYMAHLHSPALLESIAAELFIGTFNQSMDSWDQSPVATETEVAVVKFLCSLYGYGEKSDGCFTSGGSQSNLTALLLARDFFCNVRLGHDVKKKGLPESYSKFRIYTSEISHFSMEKSAHLLGLGYDAVVKVPVDENQKMDLGALRSLIEDDKKSGLLPFCVVATVGTTDFGSIDDVSSLRSLADEFGLWLHADAAYGSALVMSEKYRGRMGNLSLCDSITVDFHKMFLLSISCSCVLVKDGSTFSPLELHADYLNREEDEKDGYTNLVGKSIQTTRRFDALKVMATFISLGKDGYSNLIDTCVENAGYVYSRLVARDEFECLLKPEISSVVFRVIPRDSSDSDELNRKIRRKLMHEKGIVIGQTVFKGKVNLKFTLLNPRLTHESLDSLLDEIAGLNSL